MTPMKKVRGMTFEAKLPDYIYSKKDCRDQESIQSKKYHICLRIPNGKVTISQ